MKRLFTICVLLLAGHTFAADLRILSFNSYMLPRPFKDSLQEIRTKIIPQQVKGKNYDVILFQEAFSSYFHNDLKAALKDSYPYTYYLNNGLFNFPLVGSGLFYMSRYPMKLLGKVYFTKCADEDCLASKGSALMEIKLPSGKTVQIASTHLQSGESKGDIRMKQLAQIRQMLLKYKRPGVPQFLVGDLNIDVTEKEFGPGLDLLGMDYTDIVGPIRTTNARYTECYPSKQKEKEWIDHFWVNRDANIGRSYMQVRVLEFGFRGMSCPSSDHHAVEGYFDF